MWSIGEVKRRGWRQIGLYYWPAFLLLLIFSLASGLGEVFRVDIDSLIEGIMAVSYTHLTLPTIA